MVPDRANLMMAIRDFNLAFEQGDLETLEMMITENYRHSNGANEAIGRDEWVNYLKKRKDQLRSGELKVISYFMKNMDVQQFDDAAIITGKVETQIQRNDSIENHAYRVTNFWVLDNGKWKRAGFHDTKIY